MVLEICCVIVSFKLVARGWKCLPRRSDSFWEYVSEDVVSKRMGGFT